MSLSNLISLAEKLDKKYGFEKRAQDNHQWLNLVGQYDTGTAILDELHIAMKHQANKFWEQSEKSESDKAVYDVLLAQAELINKIKLEMEALDSQIAM